MNKIKIIICLLLFTLSLFAQSEIGNTDDFPVTTSLSDNSTFTVRHNSETRTITWATLNALLDLSTDFPSQSNTWSAAQTYTAGLLFSTNGYLQLPSAIVGTASRQLWIASDSLIYYRYGSSSIPVATREWVTDNFATSGGATSLPSTYMTLATAQTVTGNKTYTNIADYRGGTIRIPSKSSYTSSAKDNSLFVYSDGSVRITAKTSTNDALDQILASQQWVQDNYPAISGYIPTTGIGTGYSSSLTWTSGTIKPKKLTFGGRDDSRSLILPLDKNGLISAEEGSIFFDYNNDDEIKVHNGTSWITFPNTTTQQEAIEANLGSSTPTVQDSTVETLNFSNKNYINGIYGAQDAQTINVVNYAAGWTSFVVYANDDVTITIPSVTIKWVGGVTPDFSDQKRYKVVLEYLTSTTALGSYTWFE